MKYYGVFTIVPDTEEITFYSFYHQDDYDEHRAAERKKLEGTYDHYDGSYWIYAEVDDDDLD